MGRILAFPERQSANTEVLNLTATEIAALTDGLQSGMFISQSTGANAAEYRLFKSQNDCGRIDGVIAFDVAKDKLKEGANVIARVQNGILYRQVAEAINNVAINDIADTETKTTYKTLLEKQGFVIVNHSFADTI